jgi:hypothetical protein
VRTREAYLVTLHALADDAPACVRLRHFLKAAPSVRPRLRLASILSVDSVESVR